MGNDCALVLAGAVSQGAFEAGVLEELTTWLDQRQWSIRNIVGASAGALNGAVLAAHVRRGQTNGGGKALAELWLKQGSWCSFLDWPACGCHGWRGLLPTEKIVELVSDAMGSPGGEVPVSLRMVVTRLEGRPVEPWIEPASPDGWPTSFEDVVCFADRDFDSEEGRRRIAEAAAGSASFPGLFVPRELPGRGPCLDGGIVNNTPVSEALKCNFEVKTVFVVAAFPSSFHARTPSGFGFVGHVAEMLIHERLFRDLREAEAVNHWLRALERLVPDSNLRDRIIAELYPIHASRPLRPIEVVELRPSRPLEGSVFSGFGCSCVREAYLEAGREAARSALEAWRQRA